MKNRLVTAAVCAALYAPALHAGVSVELGVGGISSDKLGGNGGSKSAVSVTVDACNRRACVAGTAWKILEPLDDDDGIVPETGASVDVSTPGMYFVGARVDETAPAALLGIRMGGAQGALIVPTGNSRFGFTATVRTQGRVYQFMRYTYTGTQDPDTKDSLVTMGIGINF